MSERILIRPESPDQPEVRALLGALDAYLDSLYPAEANYILDVPALMAHGVRFLVARAGDCAVGTVAARLSEPTPDSRGERHGEIKRMYVDPRWRGQGIAERLLGAIEQTLRDADVAQALLETGRDQAAAMRLYRRCGYVERAAFGGYPDNGLSVFMAKTL